METINQYFNTTILYGCFRERLLTGYVKGMLCDGCTKDCVWEDYED